MAGPVRGPLSRGKTVKQKDIRASIIFRARVLIILAVERTNIWSAARLCIRADGTFADFQLDTRLIRCQRADKAQ